jgi:putative flippase GtrA
MSGQFLRFLSTGGAAAIVNLLSRYELNKIMSFEAAVALAYLIGMITAYVLARRFVFQASGRSVASEFKRFTIVNVFSLALVWSISIGLAKYLFPVIGFVWHADDIAHFIGVAAPAVVSYFGHRAYTFASPETVRSLEPKRDPRAVRLDN